MGFVYPLVNQTQRVSETYLFLSTNEEKVGSVRRKELFISLLSQIFIIAIYISRTVSVEHSSVRACTLFPRLRMENISIFKNSMLCLEH